MKRLILIVFAFAICSCSHKNFRSKWTRQQSPASFIARFETSKGDIDIEVTRSWSPLAADRMFQLLDHHYFDNTLFYRVVPNFVVQFGNTDTMISRNWEKYKVKDEPLVKSNLKGTVSFARAGENTRGTDVFINLKDNPRLDTLNYSGVTGFPVIGTVIKGMENVEALYSGYGDKTMTVYDSLSANRTKYLEMFPRLDSIKMAYILKK